MRVQFYKPNAKVTGSACSFWTSEDGSIMSSMIKQDSWDDSRKRGSVSKNQSKNQVTRINFGPYERNGEQIGYSYSVNKEDKEDSTNKTSFIIGFTFGEGVVLREALIDAIKNSLKDAAQPQSSYSKPQQQNQAPQQAPQIAQIATDSFDDDDEW